MKICIKLLCGICWLLVLSFVVGCKNQKQPPDSKTTQTLFGTLSTHTPTKFSSSTPKATNLEPTLTHIHTNTPTPQFTHTLSSTLIPTMIPENAMGFVLDLLKDNGNCQLPCWWGKIYPGQTYWNEAKTYLQTFASEIYLAGQEGDQLLYGVNFRVPKSVRKSEILEVSIDVEDEIVSKIFIGQPYSLRKILDELGNPTEIWIHAVGLNTVAQDGRFSLALFWNDKGVLAVYDGITKKANPIEICLTSIYRTTTSLWLWDAGQQSNFKQIGGELLFGSPPYQREFNPLEVATGIGTNVFVEEYKKLGNYFCFYMPDPDFP